MVSSFIETLIEVNTDAQLNKIIEELRDNLTYCKKVVVRDNYYKVLNCRITSINNQLTLESIHDLCQYICIYYNHLDNVEKVSIPSLTEALYSRLIHSENVITELTKLLSDLEVDLESKSHTF